MAVDITVIYFTANREHEDFESEVRKTLLDTIGPLDLPLISVSQKPLKFGTNICVGDVGFSSANAYRQLQIGAKEAKTKFVCPAESDYLYPTQYFQFVPERDDTFYIATPTWLCDVRKTARRRMFFQKPQGDSGAMIVGRDTLIHRIQAVLGCQNEWRDACDDIKRGNHLIRKRHIKYAMFDVGVPMVTFKTSDQLHTKHPVMFRSRCTELPYWGSVDSLAKRYGA